LAAVRLQLTDAEDAKSKADLALSAATSRAAEANERNQRELAEVHAKLEESESELAAVRLQLTDKNNGGAKSDAKTEELCDQNTAGPINNDVDQVMHRLMERVRALEEREKHA